MRSRARLPWRLPAAERVLGRPVHVALACVVALVVAGIVVAPQPAAALNPLDLAPNPLDLLPGGIHPTQWAVDGFKAILRYIFGDQLGEVGRHLVNLLLSVPLLTDTAAFPRLNDYRGYVTGGAWGILGLSFVVSSLRYWLSSYGGSGAYEALMGFVRTVGAIAILLVFPIVFDQLARAVNAFTSALVANPIVGNGLGKGLVAVLGTTPGTSGGGIAMLIGLAAIVVALMLLVIKVIVTALLAVLFVLSPLAIALWPIEELSWAMRSLAQAMLGLLVFPILWAVCFGTFAVLNTDALFPGNQGDVITAVLAPLITLAALIIAFRLPFAVLHQATNAGISTGINRSLSNIYHVDRVRGIAVRGGH